MSVNIFFRTDLEILDGEKTQTQLTLNQCLVVQTLFV